MSASGLAVAAIACALALFPAAALAAGGGAAGGRREIRDGRLYAGGKRVFLKVACALRNFADARDVERLIKDLPLLQSKGHNAVKINCYWHHFDPDGDGRPDASLAPLRKLVDEVARAGMFPCLSVETYGVGGGQIPKGFWEKHPDAVAISSAGREVRDTEYGFNTAVPSIHCPAYRDAARKFIGNLCRGVDARKVLYFETTVEPQYMGAEELDYSRHARAAYSSWLRSRRVRGPAFPRELPAPKEFVADPVWNRFRAEALADWVNGDAAAFRAVAGRRALVAVDYLETCGGEMRNRNGGSREFLTALDSPDIIQVNWHWHLGSRAPNEGAYRTLREVMAGTRRRWAVAEHMTLNGSDFRPEEVAALMRATLARGTRFSWEFVNVSPSSGDAFSLYNDDWSPKPLIAEVDGRWDEWLGEALADDGGKGAAAPGGAGGPASGKD